MKSNVIIATLCLAALLVAGCATPGNNASANPSADEAESAPAPTASALFALDQQANEAYFKSDAKFFEKMLSPKFVMGQGSRTLDKAATIQMIAGQKCVVSEWKLDDPQMARINADTYVLSYRGTFNGSCNSADGKSMKLPSPIRAATVWVRTGNAWQAAFHGQDPIVDPNNPSAPEKAETKKKEPKKGGAVATDSSAATDPNTAAMMAVEKTLWEAWKQKDGKQIEDLTTADLSFQNIFGTFFAKKEDALKNWTSGYCDIKSVSVSDGSGAMLSPTVGILNRTGRAEGTCAGKKLPPMPIYGTSVFVKSGDTWKLAFSLNRLD